MIPLLRPLRPFALLSALALSGSLVVVGSPPAPAAASGCAPTPAHLSKISPTSRALPGGALLRAWDTGPTPAAPRASTRIVAVRIPADSQLRPHVRVAGTLTTSKTLGSYASADSAATLAINGDFFDPARRALPVHAQMRTGALHKANAAGTPVLALPPEGAVRRDVLRTRGTVRIGSSAHAVTGLNWQSVQPGGLNVYTSAWGSTPRPYGVVDVVVVAGTVRVVRTGTDRGAPLSAGQSVLTASGTLGTQLSHLTRGTPVRFAYGAKLDSGLPVRDVIGHGSRYIEQGYKTYGPCDALSETLRPRIALGWSLEGDLIVVSVSGRSVENGVLYGGASVHQMSDYLAQLGAHSAVALDGGGSVTMIVRDASGYTRRVDRSPSDAQRPVPNAIVWR